jgi:hypothetical protein
LFGENIGLQDINVFLGALERQIFSTALANFRSSFAAGTIFNGSATKTSGT